MQSISSIRREGRATLQLALPLIAGQVSQMLMGVADTLMIGRLGVVPLAAATFANNVLHVPLMFGIGMCVAVSIRVSQARGAADPAAARAALRHGLFIASVIGFLTVIGAWAILPAFPYFRQEPDVIETVPAYFMLLAASLLPAMASMAVKNHADAMNHPWPAFWIMLAGVLLNVVLNWILIYGNWGAPSLGIEGAGLATLLARAATLAGLILYCVTSPALREWVPHRWFRKPDWHAVRRLVAVGLPTSLQLLAEVSAFVMATLIIGSMGAEALASHQVAITCAATVFMVPLGLSMALTVRIGEAWGAGRLDRLQPIVISAWLLALAFTLVSAQAFLFFHRSIASWFLTEPDALAIASALLVVAAAFQASDALQIVSSGALRGLDDVTIPAWIAVLAYWVIALPVGCFFAFQMHLGVAGIWWGITIGLTVTAAIFSRRAWLMTGPRIPVFQGQASAAEPVA